MMSRKLVLDLSFIAMEALSFFIIGAVLSGATGRDGASYWSYLAAEAGGFLLVRGMLRVDLPPRLLIAAGGVVTFIALVTICGLEFEPGFFPPGWGGLIDFARDPGSASDSAWAALIYGIFLLTLAWGRGVMVAQQRIERATALRSFSAGLMVLLIGLLFGQETVSKGAVNGASIPLVAFGLLTLALIHLREGRPAASEPWHGPWLLIVGGTIAALVMAGAAFGVLPLGPMGFVYDHVIGPAFEFALFVFTWIVIILAFPFAWALSKLIGAFNPPAQQQPFSAPQNQDNLQKTLQKHEGGLAAVFVVFFKLLAILAVVAIVCYIAYRLFRRLHRPPDENEDRDSLRSEGSIRADLAALWRSLRPHRPAGAGGPTEPSLPPGVLEVRRLYIRLLDRAAARGKTRPQATTPLEFEPVLQQDFRSAVPVHLTDAFVRARYGLVEPAPSDLTALREELKRLEG